MMMNRHARWILLAASVLLAAALAGCSLARPDNTRPQATLAGIYVRLCPQDEPDDNFYETDETAPAFSEMISSEAADIEYTLSDTALSGMHRITEDEKEFCLLLNEETDENGHVSSGLEAGPFFCRCSAKINESDEAKSVEISADVCVDRQMMTGDRLIALAPIYRQADGTLYAEQVPAVQLSSPLSGYSVSYAENASTRGTDGASRENGFSCQVSIAVHDPVTRAVLVTMSADNQPLSSRDINLTQDDLQERVAPDAAWALVEMYGGERVTRQAVNLDDAEDDIILYLPGDQEGLLLAKTLSISRAGR